MNFIVGLNYKGPEFTRGAVAPLQPPLSLATVNLMMSSIVSTQYTSVTDRQTDRQTPHHNIYRAMCMRRAVKKNSKQNR